MESHERLEYGRSMSVFSCSQSQARSPWEVEKCVRAAAVQMWDYVFLFLAMHACTPLSNHHRQETAFEGGE